MGPSAHALEALARAAREGNRYQYPETSALVEIAAGIERLRPEHFAVYPGSSLALHHAVIAFTSPTRALVTAEPGYEAAALAAGFIGAKVVRVPLCSDGAHDLPAMLEAARAEPTGLFYICNPTNPTGTVTPRAQIEALIAGNPRGRGAAARSWGSSRFWSSPESAPRHGLPVCVGSEIDASRTITVKVPLLGR
jgi:histidinol-phosphate aminotransferase